MIQKNKLLNIKKIVLHKFCHDGMASGLIIKDVLPDVEVFFADHKDPEYLNMKPEPGLLFCDISPPPCPCNRKPNEPIRFCCSSKNLSFLQAGALVLDHHEKTKEFVQIFEEAQSGVYGEMSEGISGAVLAYIHVWKLLEEKAKTPRVQVERLAKLAGIRDTWQKNSPEWYDAAIQTEALGFYPEEYFMDNHPATILDKELEVGKFTLIRFQSVLKHSLNNTVIKNWVDSKRKISKKYAILSGHRIISDAAEELRKNYVSITFAFSFKTDHNKPYLACSIRSDGSFDCNKFAGFFGGGGHIESSGGIKIYLTKNTKNPYSLIEKLLQQKGPKCLIR